MRRILSQMASLLVAMSLLAVMGIPAKMALGEDYTYTIRVFSGNKGSIGNSDSIILEKRKGEEVNLRDEAPVSVNDRNYYHKGFREAGRDSDFPYMSFRVDRDLDLVASYGMRADMARLTVHLREYGTGTALQSDAGVSERTYEFKIGDKPVIAFEHVEGYRPLYQNMTGTISGDTEWTLEYVKVASQEPTNGTEDTNGSSQPTASQSSPGASGQARPQQDGTPSAQGTSNVDSSSQGSRTPEAEGNAQNAPRDMQAETETPSQTETNASSNDAVTSNDGSPNADAVPSTTPPETEVIMDMDDPLSQVTPSEGDSSQNDSQEREKSDTIDEEDKVDQVSAIGLWIQSHVLFVAIFTAIMLGLAVIAILLLVTKRHRLTN